MVLRPPTDADAPAVFRVIEARDTADLGFADFTLEDLQEVWSASEFDLTADAAVAEAATATIVGYADVTRQGALFAVDPEYERTSASRLLLEWAERRERARGHEYHRQRIASTNSRERELLLGAGYELARFVARMVLALDAFGEAGTPPHGISLRVLDPITDAAAVHALDARAFGTAPDYVPETLSAFTEEHLSAHDHDPALSRVATSEGLIVGFLISRRWDAEHAGYASILAVHPEHQRRGIGGALLADAFAAYARAGLREAQLSVASDNPRALRLYERLGMRERFRYEIYERPARS
jgi:ribosomal protein S18 acetylase RimI-like enzyme